MVFGRCFVVAFFRELGGNFLFIDLFILRRGFVVVKDRDGFICCSRLLGTPGRALIGLEDIRRVWTGLQNVPARS